MAVGRGQDSLGKILGLGEEIGDLNVVAVLSADLDESEREKKSPPRLAFNRGSILNTKP